MAWMQRLQATKTFANHLVGEVVTFEEIKLLLNATDWVLVGPSGTKPIIRVYGETNRPTGHPAA